MTEPTVPLTDDLPKSFDPAATEPKWAKRWFEEPFRADATSAKPPFTIVIPPPNVTGNLHLGHALDNTLIDTLIRYKRMAGFETLYLPGMDHAGISTQVVVEKQLRDAGVSRHDLGREAFLERVWNWKAESGGTILGQLRRLGVSADWTRERFTMDQGLSRAVRHQFVKLYHEGLAYRGERIVNWDPAAQTTLSELEIDREVRRGKMSTLGYALEDPQAAASNGEIGEIRIATVRPETIFADQAIAVHPEDERFRHLVGQQARIPLTGRFIPIIADAAVERDFGVGALKITPAHDPTDFEIGERHGLARPSVIDLERPPDLRTGAGSVPGTGALRRPQSGGGRTYRERRADRGKRPRHRHRRIGAHQGAGGADRQFAVVREHETAGGPGAGGAGEGRDQAHAGALHQSQPRLAGKHPRLEHLAPVVVGPPDSGVVRRAGQDLRAPAGKSRPRLRPGPAVRAP